MRTRRRFALAWAALGGALFLLPWVSAATAVSPDETLSRGWRLLEEGKHSEARRELGGASPAGYDLGDYLVYLGGLALVGEGDHAGATAVVAALEKDWPRSPLSAYLSHELAVAAADRGDFEAAGRWLGASRGKVGGPARLSRQSFVEARLLEPKDLRAAAEAHLANLAAAPGSPGAVLSMELLVEWREKGRLSKLGLPVSFWGGFARALSKAGEQARARSVYAEAVGKSPSSPERAGLLLEFAEALRRQGSTTAARRLLEKEAKNLPAGLRDDADYLLARIDLRAGRSAEARARFLAIAARSSGAVAERARWQAALLLEKGGDAVGATEEYRRLSGAADAEVRSQATFRHAFSLYLRGRNAEAAEAFGKALVPGMPAAEKARYAYWRARALRDAGDAAAAAATAGLGRDAEAGPYAFLAARLRGEDPFALLENPSEEEITGNIPDRAALWDRVRRSGWETADAARVRRAERLIGLGVLEYALLEVGAVKATALRGELGLADGSATALFRYLAGDLRGAIREVLSLARDASTAPLAETIRYPLAPEFVGVAGRPEGGLDPLLIHAVIRQESLFQYDALSRAGAVGLMQLMPATAAEVARRLKLDSYSRRDLLKPSINVRLGTAYLAGLVKRYDGDYLRAVAAYNAGERAVNGWWEEAGGDPAVFVEKIGYTETRQYVQRVFANLLQYSRLYRPTTFARCFP